MSLLAVSGMGRDCTQTLFWVALSVAPRTRQVGLFQAFGYAKVLAFVA